MLLDNESRTLFSPPKNRLLSQNQIDFFSPRLNVSTRAPGRRAGTQLGKASGACPCRKREDRTVRGRRVCRIQRASLSWLACRPKGGGGSRSISSHLLSKEVVDLSMARNCRCFTSGSVDVDAVTTAFTQELDTVAFAVTDQIDPLHEIEARGSLITVLLRSVSSTSARLDSKTSWTAS